MPLFVQNPISFGPAQALANGGSQNVGLLASVGSNALTIALKTKSGTTPSTGDPVYIAFPDYSTGNVGIYNVRTVSAATTVTVSSGSTLGMVSAVTGYIYVYAIDNAGTVELAVSRMPYWAQGGRISTTAEGGAGTADSNAPIYSTAARSNVAAVLIGQLQEGETTAGTWAAGPTQTLLAPFVAQPVMAQYASVTSHSIADNSATVIDYDSKFLDLYNCVTVGSSWKFTAPFAGLYRCSAAIRLASTSFASSKFINIAVYKSGVLLFTLGQNAAWATNTSLYGANGDQVVYMTAGEYVDFRCFQNSGGAVNMDTTASYNAASVSYMGAAT